MSKRSRGPARSTHRRPGTRPPTSRPARGTARPTHRVSQLEAAEVIAEAIVEDEPVTAVRELERSARAATPRARAKPGSLLAAKAATEYLYVSQDLRRILLLSGAMFAALIALWLVFVVLRLVPLDFY